MNQELEQIVLNIADAINTYDPSTYPTLEAYRHHMRLIIRPEDQIHQLFNLVDLDDKELQDILQCRGIEVVKLNDQLTGLRLEHHNSSEAPIYWIKCNTELRGVAMSEFYDSLTNFMAAIPEEKHGFQRIKLTGCGKLIPWRSALNHIVDNPRELILGCLNHPHRYFTPSADLYVRSKARKDDAIYPTSDFVSLADMDASESLWFTIRSEVRSTTVL